ncbi:hypothetical protein NL676_032000 [Syzygium grande]|nr:hypothetical protein NL676_032000 [Syzygium grande]
MIKASDQWCGPGSGSAEEGSMSNSRDDGLETQTGRAWKNEAQHTWGFVATLLHSHVRSVLAPMTLSPNCTVLPSLSLEGMLVSRDKRTPSINRTIEGAPSSALSSSSSSSSSSGCNHREQ